MPGPQTDDTTCYLLQLVGILLQSTAQTLCCWWWWGYLGELVAFAQNVQSKYIRVTQYEVIQGTFASNYLLVLYMCSALSSDSQSKSLVFMFYRKYFQVQPNVHWDVGSTLKYSHRGMRGVGLGDFNRG